VTFAAEVGNRTTPDPMKEGFCYFQKRNLETSRISLLEGLLFNMKKRNLETSRISLFVGLLFNVQKRNLETSRISLLEGLLFDMKKVT
jgi:hypothetical protein